MEPCLYNISNWPKGVVALYLGSTLYIDGTNDNLENAIITLNKTLLSYKLHPVNHIKNKSDIKSKFINKLTNKMNGINLENEEYSDDETWNRRIKYVRIEFYTITKNIKSR